MGIINSIKYYYDYYWSPRSRLEIIEDLEYKIKGKEYNSNLHCPFSIVLPDHCVINSRTREQLSSKDELFILNMQFDKLKHIPIKYIKKYFITDNTHFEIFLKKYNEYNISVNSEYERYQMKF
jgi:hypothetical protein